MPWYWSDDVVRMLTAEGRIQPDLAASWVSQPVAFRRDEATIEDAAAGLLDDGEIPLAA